MKNQDKLIEISKASVRKSIINNGVWNGIIKYQDINGMLRPSKLVYATLTNFATLNDPNLLEFYNLS